jgi:hypothetical protein
MTEQALIEQIVAQVMSQLMTSAPSAPAAVARTRSVQEQSKPNTAVRLDVKVVTEETLEASVNGHSIVEIGDRAIITPTGRDWLRRRNVELLRGKSSASIATTGPQKAAGVAIVQSSSEAVEQVLDHFASTAGWRLERAADRVAAVRLAGCSVTANASPVVVFSSDAEAVVCEANRDPKVRAAVVNDVAAVARVKKSMQGNLFAITPAGRSFFELRYLLHSLV